MRAVVVRQHGGLEVLNVETLPDPKPRPDEAVVEIKAAGMNHLDVWIRRGLPGMTFPLPLTPSGDMAGVVKETGSLVTTFKPGDRVLVAPGFSCGACAACHRGDDHLCKHYGLFGEHRNGGAAEYCLVPGANLLPLPDSLSFEEAAAFPVTFLTAWHMLVARAALKAGETVAIVAAGSGVGVAAIQIAKVAGARVIALASTDDKLAKARELGADETVNYSNIEFSKEVKRLTGGVGADVVFEHVGLASWKESMRSLRWGGRLVTCGATTGFQVEVDLRHLFFKGLSLLGSTMGSKGEMHEILRLAGQGKLHGIVDRVLPLEAIREGHQLLENREVFGKIILKP